MNKIEFILKEKLIGLVKNGEYYSPLTLLFYKYCNNICNSKLLNNLIQNQIS